MSKLSEMPVLGKNNELDFSVEKSKTGSILHTSSEESSIDIDDYPDGGLRAWMVVCGVSVLDYFEL
jgi:hypothetical protein